jgi:hypothetical protein
MSHFQIFLFHQSISLSNEINSPDDKKMRLRLCFINNTNFGSLRNMGIFDYQCFVQKNGQFLFILDLINEQDVDEYRLLIEKYENGSRLRSNSLPFETTRSDPLSKAIIEGEKDVGQCLLDRSHWDPFVFSHVMQLGNAEVESQEIKGSIPCIGVLVPKEFSKEDVSKMKFADFSTFPTIDLKYDMSQCYFEEFIEHQDNDYTGDSIFEPPQAYQYDHLKDVWIVAFEPTMYHLFVSATISCDQISYHTYFSILQNRDIDMLSQFPSLCKKEIFDFLLS